MYDPLKTICLNLSGVKSNRSQKVFRLLFLLSYNLDLDMFLEIANTTMVLKCQLFWTFKYVRGKLVDRWFPRIHYPYWALWTKTLVLNWGPYLTKFVESRYNINVLMDVLEGWLKIIGYSRLITSMNKKTFCFHIIKSVLYWKNYN